MSLDVSCALLDQAEGGEVSEAAFLEVVRRSMPHAWETVADLADELMSGDSEYVETQDPPVSLEAQIQVLKAMAADPVRAALERHFGVKIVFQSCHRIMTFRLSAVDGDAYRYYLSPRAQVLNQRPELQFC
jgi:translation initiation factor 2B subunit (eIF-2B alpha/beta/delta family)